MVAKTAITTNPDRQKFRLVPAADADKVPRYHIKSVFSGKFIAGYASDDGSTKRLRQENKSQRTSWYFTKQQDPTALQAGSNRNLAGDDSTDEAATTSEEMEIEIPLRDSTEETEKGVRSEAKQGLLRGG